MAKFTLRLPDDLQETIQVRADREHRSLHAQIIHLLSSDPDQANTEQIEDAYARGFESGHENGYEKGYEAAEEKQREEHTELIEEKEREAYEKGVEDGFDKGYEKAREEGVA